VFFVFFFSGCPIYAVLRLGMKFSPERNKTIIGLISLKGRQQVENISFTINNFIIPLVSFFIIVVCRMTLSILTETGYTMEKNGCYIYTN
jgi:hypothetical protein